MTGAAQESRNGTRPVAGVLADRPLDSDRGDRLGYGALADALAGLIEHPQTDTPLTIALSAPWGAGKTSLAKMVENRLKERPPQRGELPHITCWFNAWMHDDAPHLGYAFAAEISKEADKHRRIFRRLANPLPTALLSHDQRIRRITALTGLSLIIAIGVLLPIKGSPVFSDFLRSIGNFGRINEVASRQRPSIKDLAAVFVLVVIPTIFTAWTRLSPIAHAVAGFIRDPNKKAATGSIQEVSNQLGKLLQQATRGKCRFVIFVDDLEQCRPPRAVEVCEVAKQLLQHRNVVTVLVADMASVAAYADLKYSSLLKHSPLEGHYSINGTRGVDRDILGETYGQEHLQKIVQITFDLPVPPAGSMQQLVNGTPLRGTFHEPGDNQTKEGQTRESASLSRGELLLDVVSRRGWKIALGLYLGTMILLGILFSFNESLPSSIAFSLVVLIAISSLALPIFVLIRCVLASIGLWRRWAAHRDRKRARHDSKRIDEQIRQNAKSDDSNAGQLAARVKRQSGEHNSELVRQRAQRYLTDESALQRQAEEELSQFLPRLPRAAKQLANHLRVMLTVALTRGMLGGQPEMTVQHLVKWAVLTSRWPELVSTLRAAPEKIAALEEASDIGDLTNRLRELNYRRTINGDLFFVLHSPAKLTPVMTRLITYGTAPDDESMPMTIVMNAERRDSARVSESVGESG